MSGTLPKEAILVVNARSRRGAAAFEEARDKLTAAGVTLLEAIPVKNPKTIGAVVKRAIAHAPMVIVGGGDGSISSNVDYFVGTETVFAILPLGTANSFAKTLGIGDDLDAAVDAIANGRRKRIDLGMINGGYYANAAAIGLSPLIADTVPPNLKKHLGMVGYAIWAARVAVGFRPFRMRLTLDDGSSVERWATEIRIANGSHHGGVELVESAEVDSGEIVVQAVTGKSVANLAWSWFATLLRLSAKDQTVEEWRGRAMHLDVRPWQKVSVDGEIECRTPINIDLAQSAIEIAVPNDKTRQLS